MIAKDMAVLKVLAQFSALEVFFSRNALYKSTIYITLRSNYVGNVVTFNGALHVATDRVNAT